MELKYYNGNSNIKAAKSNVEFTKEQIEEYAKCKYDPIYFIKNYCKIVSLDKGLIPFTLHPYQETYVNAMHNNRKVVTMLYRQGGKCLKYNTFFKIRNKITGEILEITAEEFHGKLNGTNVYLISEDEYDA